MGKHYLLNLYGCKYSHLNDVDFLIDLLENAASISGATVCQTIFKQFDPHGVTVLCLLSESHISAHTWPENGDVAVDIFTCGDCDPKIGCDVIIEQLKPQRFKLEFVQR